MSRAAREGLPPAALRLLAALAAPDGSRGAKPPSPEIVACLIQADLAALRPNRDLVITAAGRSHLARLKVARGGIDVDPFLGQHLDLARRSVATPDGRAEVTVDDAESPLAWLARRKDRSGRPLIAAEQYQAGEKLRAQFTAANLRPRTTSSWSGPMAQNVGGRGAALVADVIVAARQQVRRALDAAGPEFAGLLVDICCSLKGLEEVERERGWPARSAKVVLQLGLDRLARHYGFAAQAQGRNHAAVRTWLAPDAAFVVDGA